MTNSFIDQDVRWENLTLHCSKCKEQLGGFHFRVILHHVVGDETVLFEHVDSESDRFIRRAMRDHDCLRKADRKMIALDAVEPIFQVNQWVINVNTGDLTRITDQVLADLMNEQRAQGINYHLKPYL